MKFIQEAIHSDFLLVKLQIYFYNLNRRNRLLLILTGDAGVSFLFSNIDPFCIAVIQYAFVQKNMKIEN